MEVAYFTFMGWVILAYKKGAAKNWLKVFIIQIGFIDIWCNFWDVFSIIIKKSSRSLIKIEHFTLKLTKNGVNFS